MWDVVARHRCLIPRASKQREKNDEEWSSNDRHPKDFLITIMIRLSTMQSRDEIENVPILSHENGRFQSTKR
jgi:hypothetical protein